MKRTILSILLICGFVGATCFAETKVVDEIKASNSHFVINLGDTYYGTKRMSDYKFENSIHLNSNSFTMELGDFSSDEDGLFDWVNFTLLGFGFGKVNSDGNYFILDSIAFNPESDAKHFNIYGKSTFGLQMNLFIFSLGGTIGSKFGFDHMTQDAVSYANEDFRFTENRVFVDFAVDPYISLNVFNSVKIFFKSDFDLPVFRLRFMNHKRENYKSDTIIKWDWFKNDIPVTYMIGASFVF